MAQISYGTITITDTTDIESIVVEYAQNQDPLTAPINNWGTIRPEWAEGYYIWQRTRTHKYGTSSSEDDIGTAVCITGSPGESGKSLSSSTTQYTIATSSAVITTSNMGNYTWYNNIPAYDNSRPAYWVRVTNIYTNPSFESTDVYNGEVSEGAQSDGNEINSGNDITTVYIIYKDEGLSSAVSMSYEALDIASNNINSITRLWYAQANATPIPTINTIITDGAANRYNAWSNIRPTDNLNYPYYFYCDQTISGDNVASWSTVTLDTSTLSKYEIEATNVRTKNFFKGQDNTYDGWFASGRSTNEGLDESNATTYYYNARFAATNITLGYNKTPVIDIDGGSGAINIYRLPTINSTSKLVTAAGTLGAKLNSTALTFYNTSGIATSSFGDSISLASNGASITIGSTSTGKYNTYIDSQGLYLRTGATSYATLNSNGLTLSKGGIRVNTVGSNGGVYISSENLGTSIALDNNNRTNWRAVIGSKFGVDSEGNLYGASVKVTGDITASSMTINPNAAISDPGGLLSNDAIEIGGRNLFREDPLIRYILTTDIEIDAEKTYYIRSGTGTDEDPYIYEAVNEPILADISRYYEIYNSAVNYDAFDIELTEMPKEGETYTVQLWDVYVEHSGKTADNLGVWLCWGGESNQLCYWSGTTYFTDGYAEHLEATFTITNAQATHADAANQWFRLYNSIPSATGTKYMSVSNWKFEKGNKATDWTLAPEDIDTNLDNSVSDLNNKIEVATEMLASKEALSEIDEIVRKYLGGTGYMYSNGAYLELGQDRGEDSYKLALTPEALEFKAGDISVASLSNQELTITRTNVAETMRMGNFIWTLIGNAANTRRLILKYSPL